MTISSSLGTSAFGQAVTFTAQVLATAPGFLPDGTVDFMDGSTDLGTATLSVDASDNVIATLSTATLSVGTHSITAIYYGDGNFNGSMSAPIAQTVNAAGGTISGHTFFDVTGNGLSADDNPISGVTVKLYLDSDGNGTLDIGDGAPIATAVSGAGTGSFTFANLSAGVYFVQEVTPSGYVETAPATTTFYTVNMWAGSIVSGQDFDNFQTCNCKNDITNVKFVINGYKTVTDLRGQVHQGDVVQVKFTVLSGHCDVFSLVSYTAPSPTFNASNASQQSIYQDSTGTFGPGTYTLSVVVPKCYFQVDFVCGYAIDKFGPAGSNVFYSAQGRLISADNGGYCPPPGQG